jgi:hypothetical protein
MSFENEGGLAAEKFEVAAKAGQGREPTIGKEILAGQRSRPRHRVFMAEARMTEGKTLTVRRQALGSGAKSSVTAIV